jgi:GT2 family glycosyltransferase
MEPESLAETAGRVPSLLEVTYCEPDSLFSEEPMIPVSIVIPTYGRDAVLLETIQHLLQLPTRAKEILVIDQSPGHESGTMQQLSAWDAESQVQWLRLERPSITRAMNTGLRAAKNDLVLFVDDDVVPVSDLVREHTNAHAIDSSLWATVGQVIQPWQESEAIQPPRKLTGIRADFDFPFHSTVDAKVQNVMAGNLCVRRDRALSIGGFDENFIGAAYRFETEFARRVIASDGKILFVGSAGLKHLKAASGGTRQTGSHLTSPSPVHGFGDYYFAFLHGKRVEAWSYCLRRMFREVWTLFHLSHPWWIPVKLVGELRAFVSGYRAALKRAQVTCQRSDV